MIFRLALILPLLAASCTRSSAPTARVTSTIDAPAQPAPMPAPPCEDADVPAYVPGRTSIVTPRRAASIADIAPARSPSASLPLGSVYVAAVLKRDDSDGSRLDPTILEWDVARERVVTKVTLPIQDPRERSRILRIASTRDRVYATTECEFSTCKVRLTVLNRQLEKLTEKVFEEGNGVSLEANERYLAVAFARTHLPTRPLSIAVFDTPSLRLLGRTEMGAAGGRATGFVRGDMIELIGDRLYVAAMTPTPVDPRLLQRNEEGAILGMSTVFALDLPSLAIRTTFASDVAVQLEPKLAGDGAHVFLLASGTLTELTSELRPVRSQATAIDDATFGPDGQLFTVGGSWDPRELFPSASTPCTASWSGSEPVLVCAVDEGVRITRFTKAGSTGGGAK